MNILNKFFTYLVHHPERIMLRGWNMIAPIVPDQLFLSVKFRLTMGYWMDFSNPKTYNEKLQWLKLHDRKPEYTRMVDKAEAKEYVAERIGKEHIIPTIGVWDKPEDIPWDKLPNQFVAKVTHDSGGIVICKDKSKLNIPANIKKMSKALKKNFYHTTREWPYKDVKRRIVVEKYMVDESGYELKDYKFFCFKGHAEFFKIDYDRQIEHHANYYDCTGNQLPFMESAFPSKVDKQIVLPQNLKEMQILAERLSYGIPFVRVDLYNTHEKIFFGELTFYPASGFGRIAPTEWDYKIGEWLELPIHEK